MINLTELEIPNPVSMDGWDQIPIQPSGEELVVLNDLNPSKLVPLYKYFYQGIKGTTHIMEAREGVAKRLLEAAELLPEGYKLGLYDTYRPLTVQSSLFEDQKCKLAAENPNLNEDELIAKTKIYVSVPSGNPLKPSPHNTGGAVDLTILSPDETELDMGTPFDHFGIEAQTAYFRDILTQENVHQNRTLLYRVMASAGFTNYPEEWWHFDFGNQFWAKLAKADHAIYGPYQTPYNPSKVLNDPETKTLKYRVRASGPLERFVSWVLAGGRGNLARALTAIDALDEPDFFTKQQMAKNTLTAHNVIRID